MLSQLSLYRFVSVLLVVCGLSLSACESMDHEDQGRVIGGVLGGVLGAEVGDGSGRTAAIIVGTLAGSMIGAEIGKTMDDVDRNNVAKALNDNRTNATSSWINPDTGREYSVAPTRTFDGKLGPCREFSLVTSDVNQPDQTVYGTACLREDGTWVLQ